MLAGDDVLNIGTNAQTLLVTSGNVINGGAGVDTLKLAAGTALNLETLTTNQTVKPIEQVEVFTLQGSSALTLSANDVLSLGGANASTMSAYSFASTSGGTASTASTGKVQMVIHGTSSDTLVLDPLKTDGVTTNGIVGNTGLAGQWDYMGTTTANGATYKIYNQSTTGAQVLVDQAVNVIIDDPVTVTNVATFSSMTKDSSLATATADWLTNDASAGRLVSGTLASALAAGDVVKVYANGTLIGNATVNSAGTAWEITDTNGYNANWTYTAQVVNSAGKGGTATVQQVNLDNTEAAPTITSVTDSASTNVADGGTTTNTLSTVSGTGNAGDTIYLYDNTGTNLVGTTTVASNGTWSISSVSSLPGVGSGSNTFSARQVDALGNASALSNLWTVTAAGNSVLTNGDFSNGLTGWTTYPTQYTGTSYQNFFNNTETHAGVLPASYYGSNVIDRITAPYTTTSTTNSGSGTITVSNHYDVQNYGNPDGSFAGNVFAFNNNTSGHTVVLSQQVNVVAGQAYTYSFDYTSWMGADLRLNFGSSYVNFAPWDTADPYINIGHVTGTFTASTTGSIAMAFTSENTVDFNLDNLKFMPNTVAADNSLVAGGTPPFTGVADGTATAITYTGGVADMMGGNDLLNADPNIGGLLAAGGLIDGGAGLDRLKLAAGSSLNLASSTSNQTVKPIQEVEVLEMQGNSVISMTANDVLSLGSSDTTIMGTYAFTAGSMTNAQGGGTSSTGKVQLVIDGTSTDLLNLAALTTDSVTTNGVLGNTGLAGQWDYKGNVTVGGNTYKVYDHSTTKAQVLVDADININPGPITDVTPPTVSITRASGSTGNMTNSENFVFTFSEAIYPGTFSVGDLDLVGCTVANVSPDLTTTTTVNGVTAYTKYTATVVPTAASGSTISVGIAAGKFADFSGNVNLDTYSTTADSVANHVVETTVGTNANIISATYVPVTAPTAAYAINGNISSLASGLYVSTAGDVNGDGLEDVIIAAQTYSQAWVVFGTSNAQTVNLSSVSNGVGGFAINAVTSTDNVTLVSNAGDVNGDGLTDLVVKAGSYNYVVYGKTDTAAINLSTITNNAATAQNAGFQIANAGGFQPQPIGDFNGDGIDDLIINNTAVGSVDIIFGKHDNNAVNLTQTGTTSYLSISGIGVNGARVEAGGDVNGDGLNDVVVYDKTSNDVYVVYGTTQTANIALTNLGTNGYKIDQAGGMLAGTGDLVLLHDMNGDGLADVVYNDNSNLIHVVYGQTGNSTISVSGTNVGSTKGFDIVAPSAQNWVLETAGDFNGDGLTDLLIGNPSTTVNNQATAGNLYLVYGRADTPRTQISLASLAASDGLDLTHVIRDPVTFVNAQLGRDYTFSTAGDMNGDGFDDLIIGQWSDTPSGSGLTQAGVTYIVYGGQYGGTTASKVDYLGSSGNDNLVGTSADEHFVAGSGDDILTGNGGADSMIGGAGNDTFVLNADNVAKLASTTGAVNAQVDGGTGIDTIKLDGAGITLDLTALPSAVIKDVEHFDITGSGNNTLKLSLNDVIQHGSTNVFDVNASAVTPDTKTQLMVTGDAGDTLQLKDLTTAWSNASSFSYNGHTYDVYNSTTSSAQLLIDHQLTLQNF